MTGSIGTRGFGGRAVDAHRAGLVLALLGAAAFALGGLVTAADSLAWLSLPSRAAVTYTGIGAGVALVGAAAVINGAAARVRGAGTIGLLALGLLGATPLLYVVAWLIEFAIVGTFALILGTATLAGAAWRGRLGTRAVRIAVTAAAVAAATWNTETVSVGLLAITGAGLAYATVSWARPRA